MSDDPVAGIQGTSSPASCVRTQSESESVETEIIVIVVTLPMTKVVFIANQDKYIESVAITANVIRENVLILSIDEVSTRSSRIITARLLLATTVSVQTSVLIAMGQQSNIMDQSMLNSNLNGKGLPSGTLVVLHNKSKSVVDVTTPAPWPGAEAASGSVSSSSVSIGAIVGGVVGLSVFIGISFLAIRFRKNYKA